MGVMKLKKPNAILLNDVEGYIEKEVIPIGNTGHIYLPKSFIGRKVYVIIDKDVLDKVSI